MAAGIRSALLKGLYAGADEALGRYVVHPRAELFARVWSRASAIPGWLEEPSAAALVLIMAETRPTTVVEIGSYLGRSTVLFGAALQEMDIPGGRVIAIDPHTGDRQHLEKMGAATLPSLDLFRHHIRAAGVAEIVTPVVEDSARVGSRWDQTIGFLYVDGWHSYDAVTSDGRLYLPHLGPEGVVVFDDYGRYPEVAEAVDQLAREGSFHMWGRAFGQAVGGVGAEPPLALRRLFRPGRLKRAVTRR